MAKNPYLLKLGLLFEIKALIDEEASTWLHFQQRFLQTSDLRGLLSAEENSEFSKCAGELLHATMSQ